MLDDNEIARLLHRRRGVDDPCKACHGWGCRSYSSTATWRGGIGGQAFCMDICDKCWGTGDSFRIGTDIRALEQKQREWEREQCLQYFARVTGSTLSVMREHVRAMADILSAQERKRKIPEGFNEFWWRQSLHAVASSLRALTKEPDQKGAE